MRYSNGPIVSEEGQRESFGELLGDLAGQSAGLVRDEIKLARQEVKEKLHSYKGALVLLLTGGIIGLFAAVALGAAFVIWLGEQIGMAAAAALTGLGLVLIAGALLLYARAVFSHLSLKPEQTIETLEEDKVWLKQLT
jgi:uncharacterized membrane protein YqjE